MCIYIYTRMLYIYIYIHTYVYIYRERERHAYIYHTYNIQNQYVSDELLQLSLPGLCGLVRAASRTSMATHDDNGC